MLGDVSTKAAHALGLPEVIYVQARMLASLAFLTISL